MSLVSIAVVLSVFARVAAAVRSASGCSCTSSCELDKKTGDNWCFVESSQCGSNGCTCQTAAGGKWDTCVPATTTSVPTSTAAETTTQSISSVLPTVAPKRECCFYERADKSGQFLCSDSDVNRFNPWSLNDALQYASIGPGCETVIYAAMNYDAQSVFHSEGEWDFSALQLDEAGRSGPFMSSFKCDCTGSGRLRNIANHNADTATTITTTTTATRPAGKSNQCCFYSSPSGADEYCSAQDQSSFSPWELNDKMQYAQIAEGCETVIYAAIDFKYSAFRHGSGWWDFSGMDVDGPGVPFVSSFRCSCDGSDRLQQEVAALTPDVPAQCCFYSGPDKSGPSLCSKTDVDYFNPWSLNDALTYASISPGCETVVYAAIRFEANSAYHGSGEWDFSDQLVGESADHSGPVMSSFRCDCSGSGRLKGIDCKSRGTCIEDRGSSGLGSESLDGLFIALGCFAAAIIFAVGIFICVKSKQQSGGSPTRPPGRQPPRSVPAAIGRPHAPLLDVPRTSPNRAVSSVKEPEAEMDTCSQMSKTTAGYPAKTAQTERVGVEMGTRRQEQQVGRPAQLPGAVSTTFEQEPEEIP